MHESPDAADLRDLRMALVKRLRMLDNARHEAATVLRRIARCGMTLETADALSAWLAKHDRPIGWHE